MVRYLCQSCNSTYVNNHVCFFYKKNDYVHSIYEQDETDVNDGKNDCIDVEFIPHSNGKSCPTIQQKNTEEWEQSNSLHIKNKEQVSFTPSLKRERKFSTFKTEKTSNNSEQWNAYDDLISSTLYDPANEIHSEEEGYLTNSSENFVSPCRFKNCFLGDVTRKPSTLVALHEENNGEAGRSRLIHDVSSEELTKSLDENKWHSLNGDKKIFKEPSQESKNISITSKVAAFPQRNNESDKDTFEVSVDRPNISKLPSVMPRAVTRSMTNKGKVSPVSMEVEYNVAGPSKISIDSLRDKSPFTCELCFETFSLKSKLKRHYWTHTGKKLFTCDRCDKEFTQKVNLEVHYRKHTGENPFKCDKCGKAFTQKVTLKNHYRKHTGEKPFVCEICKKGFAYKISLAGHNRTHTGEKPYKCEICEKTFAQNGTRKTHYKLIHKLIYK